MKPFYITTTLPYVNADLHMGHALEFVRADVIARYRRLKGDDVFFNTGTDEHGMKIFEKAKEQGLSPQDFVDKSFVRFQESVKIFGLDPEIHYSRTTSEHHIKAAQEFWKRCLDNGYIYKKAYKAKYCVGCEEVKTDSELVNGECPVHAGKPLETIEEENYFFRYSAFTEKLLSFYESRPDFVVPDFRFNEIKAFVTRGLEDFSISRLKEKMPWGIPVPQDSTHVMYVWFDALVNYISTLNWPQDEDPDSSFGKYWLGGTPTQYCGKDNLRFQSAMWQAMLMACGLPNSRQIIINGFITGDGGVKMSKTLGNVVDPKEIVNEYGTDALRLFLTKEVSSFEDSPFTIERFKNGYNSSLANGLGNLLSRTLAMATTLGGTIKKHESISLSYEVHGFSSVTKIEATTIEGYIQNTVLPNYEKSFEKFDIAGANASIWELLGLLDRVISRMEPFRLIKTEPEKAEAIIYDILCGLFAVSKMLAPILPATSLAMTLHLGEYQTSRPDAFTVQKLASPLFPRK
ncbi:MAG: methionine--tRNA ligase [Candidatus Pacebacteria bacterium]|nr:methionine--tRNA ligase [Candidatus Paceibacterota bacterium]